MSTSPAPQVEAVPPSPDTAIVDAIPRDGMPRGSVYFAGMLFVVSSKRKGRPTLLLSAFCPYCQLHHAYSWRSDLPVTPDVVISARAKCKAGPWKRQEVYVGLAANEPATERNRKIHAQALAEYAAWAGRPSEDAAGAEKGAAG